MLSCATMHGIPHAEWAFPQSDSSIQLMKKLEPYDRARRAPTAIGIPLLDEIKPPKANAKDKSHNSAFPTMSESGVPSSDSTHARAQAKAIKATAFLRPRLQIPRDAAREKTHARLRTPIKYLPGPAAHPMVPVAVIMAAGSVLHPREISTPTLHQKGNPRLVRLYRNTHGSCRQCDVPAKPYEPMKAPPALMELSPSRREKTSHGFLEG